MLEALWTVLDGTPWADDRTHVPPECFFAVLDAHEAIGQAVRHQLPRLAVAGMIDHFLLQGEGRWGWSRRFSAEDPETWCP